MTDAGLVLHKLQRLNAQVALTRARRPATADVLSHDLVLRDALALAFMVALQETIDIAYHVVADEGWGIPDSHRAAFELLAAHADRSPAALAGAPERTSRARRLRCRGGGLAPCAGGNSEAWR